MTSFARAEDTHTQQTIMISAVPDACVQVKSHHLPVQRSEVTILPLKKAVCLSEVSVAVVRVVLCLSMC